MIVVVAAIILLHNKNVVLCYVHLYDRRIDGDIIELGTFIRIDCEKIPVRARNFIHGFRTAVGFSSVVVYNLGKYESTTVV